MHLIARVLRRNVSGRWATAGRGLGISPLPQLSLMGPESGDPDLQS